MAEVPQIKTEDYPPFKGSKVPIWGDVRLVYEYYKSKMELGK